MPWRNEQCLHKGKKPLTSPYILLLFQIHLFLRQRIPFQILFILTQQGQSPGVLFGLRGPVPVKLLTQLLSRCGAPRGIPAPMNLQVTLRDLPPLRRHARVAFRIRTVQRRADQIMIAA